MPLQTGIYKMTGTNRFRISYRIHGEIRSFDVMGSRLSASDVYAEICYREAIIYGLGVPGMTFKEIASRAGVTDMSCSALPHRDPQLTPASEPILQRTEGLD